jgi:hypothetical protein
METTHEPMQLENEVWYNKNIHIYVSFELLFSLMELLNKTMVRFQTFEMDAKPAPVNVGTRNVVC